MCKYSVWRCAFGAISWCVVTSANTHSKCIGIKCCYDRELYRIHRLRLYLVVAFLIILNTSLQRLVNLFMFSECHRVSIIVIYQELFASNQVSGESKLWVFQSIVCHTNSSNNGITCKHHSMISKSQCSKYCKSNLNLVNQLWDDDIICLIIM